VDCASEGEGKGAVGLSENRGSDVREMGCYFERFRVGFEGGSGGEESADSLGEWRGRFLKKLTRRNRNRGSRGRTLRLTALLSFSRGHGSLGIGGGGLRGHGGGGTPVGVQMTGGLRRTGGVFPFGELLCFPGVGVFFGKRLRVAIHCGR